MEYRSHHHQQQQQQQQQQRRRREEEEEDGMGYNNSAPPLPPPPPPVPMRVSAFSKPCAPPQPVPPAPSPSLLSPISALPVRNGTDTPPAATQLRSTTSPADPLLVPITSIIPPASPPPPPALKYRECLRNHAAALGGHVLDGCGEYMAADEAEDSSAAMMKCAACGCHRSFHRRESTDQADMISALVPPAGTYYRNDRMPVPLLLPPPHPPTNPHHHHHHHVVIQSHHNSYKQLVPPAFPPSPSGVAIGGNNNSGGSGATTESSSEDRQEQQQEEQQVPMQVVVVSRNKRFRTKFTAEQKEKMLAFAERVGWRFHKQDAAVVEHFCREVGVRRQVLKVWMHNNKHSIKKQQQEQQQQSQLQLQQQQQQAQLEM